MSSRRALRLPRLIGQVRKVSYLLGAALALAGCHEPTGPEREISGERLYQQHCARCHGPDGKGLKEVPGVRDLTDRGVMSTISDERIRTAIRMGRPPTMPAFTHFAEPSLKVLAAYVRQLSEPAAAAEPPAP